MQWKLLNMVCSIMNDLHHHKKRHETKAYCSVTEDNNKHIMKQHKQCVCMCGVLHYLEILFVFLATFPSFFLTNYVGQIGYIFTTLMFPLAMKTLFLLHKELWGNEWSEGT